MQVVVAGGIEHCSRYQSPGIAGGVLRTPVLPVLPVWHICTSSLEQEGRGSGPGMCHNARQDQKEAEAADTDRPYPLAHLGALPPRIHTPLSPARGIMVYVYAMACRPAEHGASCGISGARRGKTTLAGLQDRIGRARFQTFEPEAKQLSRDQGLNGTPVPCEWFQMRRVPID